MISTKNIKDPIDIIFPYVDCNDPNWQALYNEAVTNRNNNDLVPKKLATGDERFRENGLLKYVFRSIEKHIPWVNKVHMIVQSESQIPKWINRKNVNIVYHKDFIPEEYLPTFNSGTIEMFLHKIEPLSNKFIYGNDDTFFNYNFKPTDFFLNNRLVFGVKRRLLHKKWIWDTTLRLNDQQLLRMSSSVIYEIQHTFTPHMKSLIADIHKIHKNKIYNSISQFRMAKNYNHWIYGLYYYKNGKMINRHYKYGKEFISERSLNKLKTNWNRYKSICLNDSDKTSPELIRQFIDLFEIHFPKKSKYEL